MKKFLLYLLLVGCAAVTTAYSQDRMWTVLTGVKIENIRHKTLGYAMWYPTFTPEILALNGKTVSIKGYVVPMDEGMGFFALSMMPYQSCFFCGKAGPETVIEIHAKKPVPYTQRAITLRGTLEINTSGDYLSHLMYILNDAEQVE
jgi:hypothetical protein